MRKVSNILWGIVFVTLGVIFGINALEIAYIDIFFDGWWTLFIIIPSFIGLFKDSNKEANLILLLIGGILFLSCRGLFSFALAWKLMFPAILVIIGLSFIFKNLFESDEMEESKIRATGKKKEYCVTFSSNNLYFEKDEFETCDITAVFGSIQCDLRKCEIKEDKVINVTSVFGGVDILVPDDVKVKVRSTPIFGGVSNKARRVEEEKAKTLYINAVSVFGGVDVK